MRFTLFFVSTIYAQSFPGCTGGDSTCVLINSNNPNAGTKCIASIVARGQACGQTAVPGFAAPTSCLSGVCISNSVPSIAGFSQQSLGITDISSAVNDYLFIIDENLDN